MRLFNRDYPATLGVLFPLSALPTRAVDRSVDQLMELSVPPGSLLGTSDLRLIPADSSAEPR